MSITSDLPKSGRKPLIELDEITIKAIKECEGDVDTTAALKIWLELRDLKLCDNNHGWIHGDLLRPNLLVFNGKLSAIIDFGRASIGDPALDIIPAWAVLTSKTRALFRSLLGVDDATWLRAKANALYVATTILPFYKKSNPEFAQQAKSTIINILNCEI